MTIKQASDLHFTYVRNTPELREAFINKCKEFGILVWGDDDKIGSYLEVFACEFDDDDKFEIVFTDNLEFQSKELFIGDLINVPTETPEEKEVLDDIESSGEVEWKNGDECLYMNSSELHKFIGIDPTRNDFCYIKANCAAVNWVEISKLSKPETPQQREDRERLEVIDEMCWDVHSLKFSQASALYEVGYRKEKTHGTN
ncbi:hypothetical protein [Vibrio phage vB_VcM_SY]